MSDIRTALYRLFNADDRLLYVGISNDPKVRWRQHHADKAWAPDVAMRVIEWHDSRSAALLAELKAIRAERPMHNIVHARAIRKVRPIRPLPKPPVIDEATLAAGAAAITAIGYPGDRALTAMAMIPEMRRVHREALTELKKTMSYREIGKLFSLTGSRIEQFIKKKHR